VIELVLVLLDGYGSVNKVSATVAEFWMTVPDVVDAATCVVSVSGAAVAPLANAALYVHRMEPVPPTAGVVHVQFVPA
jgi:hypothetical protein